MFIGREHELKMLKQCYESDQFAFVVIYGRRRIGKTALINHFIADKKAIYFMGVESNEKQNLANFSKSLIEYQSGIGAKASFLSFQDALEYVFQLAAKERILLAIDEYPYVAHASKSLASTLQFLIDKYKDTSKLMLILCGSSMSYMEDHVLSYKAPLYGRRSAQMKLRPFSFREVCQCLPHFSNEEQALAYGIIGGTPQYLLQMNDRIGMEENIQRTFLNPTSFLYEEPMNLLKQEMREPSVYMAIITAIAGGASRMSQIADKVGEPTNVCATYIKHLIDLEIVERETPFKDTGKRKSVYFVNDPMFRFWFRFIPDHNSLIARGGGEIVYRRIEPYLNEYMGKVFEDICREYLWAQLLDGTCPVLFSSIGRWWGNDPKRKCQAEIDIIAEQDKHTLLMGECKWTNETVDVSVLDTLMDRKRLFPHKTVHYYLFAKRGFSERCIQKAEALGNVYLVSFPQLCINMGIETH